MSNKEIIIDLLKSTNRKGIEQLIGYLETIHFFQSPASTKFHGNFEGGLAEHSLNVYTLICEKNTRFQLNIPPDSLIITGLLHDICKCGVYKKTIKNVKEGKKINYKGQEVDNWVEKTVLSFDDPFPIGHGEKSVILIQQFIKLSAQEVIMIRWHMGATDLNGDTRSLYKAYELYPEAVALHTADFEASQFLEETIDA